MQSRAFFKAALVLGSLSASGVAQASYPAGIWVKVQDVTLEPATGAPSRVQIHGAVMLFDNSTNGSYYGYTEPALGYLYYECPKGQEATCASEWADVKKNIAEPLDVCVGLGDQKTPTGSLRAPGTPASVPDVYPIAMGVLPGYTPCKMLEGFLLAKPDAGAAGAGGAAGGGGGGEAGAAVGGNAGQGGAASGGANSGGSAGAIASGGSSGSGGAPTGSGGSSASSGGAQTDDDGGCTIARSRSSSVFGLLCLAAMALFGARRRRRGGLA